MPRYKAHIAYKGTDYSGWQRQANAMSVQEMIESKLSILCNQPISIVGCGRTDAGVHASNYIFHFDFETPFSFDVAHRLNRLLPDDIAIKNIQQTSETFHARYDAYSRTYTYYLIKNKSPFDTDLKTRLPRFDQLNTDLLHSSAALLLNYDEFFPFCKTNSDAESMTCHISESQWEISPDIYVYTITGNRFLRGMVRLIVGLSIRIALGEVKLAEMKAALDNQHRLAKSWSAPAHGLYLSSIRYPE